MEKYNKNDPEAVMIRKKLKKLMAENDNIKIFDTISIEEVNKFEEENNILLPEDYVWFITNVGNGGQWEESGYYFYPLEKTYFSDEGLPNYQTGRPRYAIDVLSKGCSYSIGLVLEDDHYGEIAYDGDGLSYYHPIPLHGFKEFYLKWLDEAVLGYDELDFECRPYGTIEEHLEQYRSSHDIDMLRSIYSKANTKCASKEFICDIHDVFVSESENENKVMLARILIKTGYKDTFSVLNEIFIPHNYESFVWELHSRVCYFAKWLYAEGIMKDAPKYYSMLVKVMKYYETAQERKYFSYCFDMTVMNPKFKPNDIIGILTSDDEYIVKYLAESVYNKNILERVGKYVEAAKVKYEKMCKK